MARVPSTHNPWAWVCVVRSLLALLLATLNRSGFGIEWEGPPRSDQAPAREGLPATTAMKVPDLTVIHPLVLLSVVDNYNRVAKDTKKRVVGVLLGEVKKGVVVSRAAMIPIGEAGE